MLALLTCQAFFCGRMHTIRVANGDKRFRCQRVELGRMSNAGYGCFIVYRRYSQFFAPFVVDKLPYMHERNCRSKTARQKRCTTHGFVILIYFRVQGQEQLASILTGAQQVD